MAIHSSVLACRIPWTEGGWQATVHRVTETVTTEHTVTDTFANPFIQRDWSMQENDTCILVF